MKKKGHPQNLGIVNESDCFNNYYDENEEEEKRKPLLLES
jgi:hypothetical protein